MNKKLSIIIGVVVVAAVAVGYFAFRSPDNDNSITEKDPTTGQATYTNLDYGFSIVYGSDWAGPAETKDKNAKNLDPLNINAVFLSTSTLEAVVIGGKPGDKESFNEAVTSLDIPYQVITVGGSPALRYEYVSATDEEGTSYTKTVLFVFKGLKAGSVTMAYQKMFSTEAEAKKADLAHLNDFLTHIRFF
jgi:hypothetical protein